MIGGLSIHLSSMANSVYRDCSPGIVDQVDHAIGSLAQPVQVVVARQFFGARWSRFSGQHSNPVDDSPPIGLAVYAIKFLRRGGLDVQPICGHGPSDL